MADTKISALNELTTIEADADKLPIVDDSTTETKYITPENLSSYAISISTRRIYP